MRRSRMNYVDRRNKPKTKPMSEQDKLLLTINEWLDAIGCDRAYRKDMKETYKKAIPELKAQLAKLKQHYEQDTAGHLIRLNRGKAGLDRPELREELPQDLEYQLDSAQLREWMRERSWGYLGGTQEIDKSRTWYYMSPKGTAWKLVESWGGKVISILALIPDIDQIRIAEMVSPNEAREAIEEAKKQERRDIGLELQLATSKVVNKPNFNQYRLSEFITIAAHKLIKGQVLKEGDRC